MLKGRKSSMTPERVAALEGLGFSWEVRPGLERPRATWQQRYDELLEFHKENRHFLVPVETHGALNSWCQEQKQRLKYLDKNNGRDTTKRMGPERVKALFDVGFTKDVDLADAHVTYKETHDPKDDGDDDNSSVHDNGDEEMKGAEATAGLAKTKSAADDNTKVQVNEAGRDDDKKSPGTGSSPAAGTVPKAEDTVAV